ncbi:hypothetical protein HC931_01110 [Candidatus Gracilibacteria bacterium]|nr:hypothetical protein [Candidatus Gracilibacteria bacterium]
MPDPSYVRSRYAGEVWQEFKDATQNLRHELIQESLPSQPGQCPVRYRFFTRARVSPTSAWSNRTLTMQANPIGPIKQLRLFLFSGDVRQDQELTFLSGPPPDRFVEGKASFGEAWLYVLGKNLTTGADLEIRYSASGSGFGRNTIVRVEYLGMQRIDNLPDNCSPGGSTCTFRVLGANNAVIYSEKRAVCPEAITVPEAYGSNTDNFVISNSRQNVPLKIVNSEANNRKSTSVLLGNTVIKKLDSPLGASLMPRVCWDCTEDEKCPENTCSVDCGDRICCYNSLGISIKEIRKGP